MLNATPAESKAIYSERIDDQVLEVRQLDHFRWMTIDGNAIQTLVNINEPSQLLLPNIRAMLGVLLYAKEPMSVLNLGMGGGAFERTLLHNFPELKMTSIEQSEQVIHAANNYFSVPYATDIILSSAEDYLRINSKRFDIILCDIFSKENHPGCLYDSQFYAYLSKALNSSGALALNLSPDTEAQLVEILLLIRKHFSWVSLLTPPDCSNIILFISQNQPPEETTLKQRATLLKKTSAIDLVKFSTQVQLLPKKEHSSQLK